jgi:hypothetical protein
MRSQWIASEHYRLHTVEGWPDSPYKEATLRAIHSTLESLSQDPAQNVSSPPCQICLSRRKASGVLKMRGPQFFDRAA